MVFSTPNFTNSSAGLDDLGCYLSSQIPTFWIGILLLIFCVITMAGYFTERSRNQRANFFMWATIGGTITSILSFVLAMMPCLLNISVCIISLVITFACALLFLITEKDD